MGGTSSKPDLITISTLVHQNVSEGKLWTLQDAKLVPIGVDPTLINPSTSSSSSTTPSFNDINNNQNHLLQLLIEGGIAFGIDSTTTSTSSSSSATSSATSSSLSSSNGGSNSNSVAPSSRSSFDYSSQLFQEQKSERVSVFIHKYDTKEPEALKAIVKNNLQV